MPCFKGLAVSIHANDGPLPEYSVQKQSRLSRINAYIPVPPPKIPEGSTSNRPEQSSFAISITLLTPGQNVPYSTPKATEDDPYPRPKLVSGMPGETGSRIKDGGAIGPYIPLTTSPAETIAAYIYFDGRAKEEVATLLRRGEETWVNSRWVGIPESEGGGLAERDFLFREVGLERWLNGLDLDGKDVAAKIERRRQKMEKRRRKHKEVKLEGSDDEKGLMEISPKKPSEARGVLRYGADEGSPLEKLSDDDDVLPSDSDSDDDDPIPETAGQIKVALFRVVASGEIKRGEYSPQFDAHDDDDDSQNGRGENGHANGSGGDDGDVDHTTSFAKPKSLDPKSISTQTVTGIDPTDKPYAIFTFMYRGERQLQKMGIIHPPKSQEKAAPSSKRRSVHTDFSSLGPLKQEGTVGYSTFRDPNKKHGKFDPSKSIKKSKGSDMDSDEDEDDECAGRAEDVDETDDNDKLLSLADAERGGELAEGVRKIKLKRQHSAEPLTANTGTPEPRKTSKSNTPIAGTSPPNLSSTPPPPLPGSTRLDTDLDRDRFAEESIVGSPLKKQRASLAGLDDEMMRRRLGLGLGGTLGEIFGTGDPSGGNFGPQSAEKGALGKSFGGSVEKSEMKDDDDEEL